MKIGIPKALYYYYFFDKFKFFFEELGIELISSDDTNKEIIDKGSFYASDEMCLSLKIFLGHIDNIKDKCDYILIPIIDNYGLENQMCCNFLSLYDLVNNLFNTKILTFKIDYKNNKKEIDGFIKIGKELGFNDKDIKNSYKKALIKEGKLKRKRILKNRQKLNSLNKKVLLVSHSYNMYDNYISKDIISFLETHNCEVIYSDCFDEDETNILSKYLSKELYWKYSKENIGSIIKVQEDVDGVLFLTTFPCGLDSLVNELVMRKISKPYLDLVIDDLDSTAGLETRLESFVDILEQD